MTTNFDRAASFYDDTRGLPVQTLRALTDRLAEGLGGASNVLEIGVGTGRVAVPLCERGYAMTGVDVSPKMLAVLDAKSSAVQTRTADATALPFDDASFDAVLAVDVFHLVSAWRRAVEEAARVLRPGGSIVLSSFEGVADPTIALRQRIFQEAGAPPRRVGVDSAEVMADLAGRFDATTTELAAVPHVMETSLGAELEGLRAGTWSRYWELSDELRHRVADRIEAQLRDAGDDLAAPLAIELRLSVWVASDLRTRRASP